jgi:hypothetical protein
MTPLYLLIVVFPKFDPLTATGMVFISQNFKIYLAYTETKRNQL